jgi:HlyD family secretion protein
MDQDLERNRPRRRWSPLKVIELSLSLVMIVLLAAYFLQAVFRNTDSGNLTVTIGDLTIEEVRLGPLHEHLPVEATVQPMSAVSLAAVEGGRVEKVWVEVGAVVREGDPIVQLSNQGLVMDVMLRQGQIDQETNNLRSARLSLEQFKLQLSQQLNDLDNQILQQKKLYDRYVELDKDSLISKLEFERARDQYDYLLKRKDLLEKSQKTELAVRNASIESLEQSIARMKENLEIVLSRQAALLIAAPVYGQVTSLSAEVGQSKTSGDRLGQIDALSGFKAAAFIDEAHLDRVALSQTGVFDIDGRPFSLAVKKIFPEVRDGKFGVELEFKGDRPKGIKRGQTLHVRLELGEVVEAVILPKGKFLEATEGEWVYKLGPDRNYALKTAVKLGREDAEAIEVLRGLRPGDWVITSSYAAFGSRDRFPIRER